MPAKYAPRNRGRQPAPARNPQPGTRAWRGVTAKGRLLARVAEAEVADAVVVDEQEDDAAFLNAALDGAAPVVGVGHDDPALAFLARLVARGLGSRIAALPELLHVAFLLAGIELGESVLGVGREQEVNLVLDIARIAQPRLRAPADA